VHAVGGKDSHEKWLCISYTFFYTTKRELCYTAVPGCYSVLTLRSHNAPTEEGRALEHATYA